ncbi:hypothetical protein POTOM_055288 [Populus tomentosa]|uniref:non-specific serine/threonine protein kinase n=1 Tax=Populus tomentosa TaxID=118781 RepID=A0A8X7Y0U5_POPTO|nr:hypothetical protein POTOM_055288 [Populus tomentosa]
MQPHVFPTMSWFITFIAMTFICGWTLVFANDDERYVNCSNSFDCGDIKGVGYPFWGSNRPDYCGYPELKLDCSTAQDLEITIEKLTYKVLGIDDLTRTLSVARKDYEKNICPTLILNTTWIPNLLNYTSDDRNITIYYGCPTRGAPTSPLVPQFPCKINATEMTGYFIAFASLSDLGSSASSLFSYLGTCNDSIKVPVRESAFQQILSTPTAAQLLGSLNEGFGLEWNASNSLCDTCQLSGGTNPGSLFSELRKLEVSCFVNTTIHPRLPTSPDFFFCPFPYALHWKILFRSILFCPFQSSSTLTAPKHRKLPSFKQNLALLSNSEFQI